MSTSPAFGQADLTNCERELIHLTGSVQPHGVLFVVDPSELLTIKRVSRNTHELLGKSAEDLFARPLDVLGGDLVPTIQSVLPVDSSAEPVPLRCHLPVRGEEREFEGPCHRLANGELIVELEPIDGAPAASAAPQMVDLDGAQLVAKVEAAVKRFSAASTIERLAEDAVRSYRDLVGYDRVMVYRFDPDGHGAIIAEAREPRLESLLGHHYPATDIPQRARELYIRNKLRVLVDVHYTPAPLEPRPPSGTAEDLDLSMSYLRSMSPLHLQYLKNMGVTATLVVSLVHDGQLWGLIACHHYSPRNMRVAVRTAADLLAEVISTRIAAIESFAHAQAAVHVRRLEQRLVEATSTEGDWRLALLRSPRALLQPLDATGAALCYDHEILTTGIVPSTPHLRELVDWITENSTDGFFSTSSISRTAPKLASLTPTASGVLATRLSLTRPDYLMWFRREQLHTVTWAGDPSKPMISDDPMELSPRRSFAAWSELVRGTAVRWTEGELATGRAFGAALVNIIIQINAVRLLIVEDQRTQLHDSLTQFKDAVLVTSPKGHIFFASASLAALSMREKLEGNVADLFDRADDVHELLSKLKPDHQSWRGELELMRAGKQPLTVAARVEAVPARNGAVMGFIFIIEDLTDSMRAAAVRGEFERALNASGFKYFAEDSDKHAHEQLMSTILSSASLAAMDIVDGGATPSVVPRLRELESSTLRMTALYQRIRSFTS